MPRFRARISSHLVKCLLLTACAIFRMCSPAPVGAQEVTLPEVQQKRLEERWRAQREGVRNADITFRFIGIPPAHAATKLTEEEVAAAIGLLNCEDLEDGFESLADALSRGGFKAGAGLEVSLKIDGDVRVEETELVHQLHDSEAVIRKSKSNRQINLFAAQASHRFSHTLDDLRIPAPAGLARLSTISAGDGRVRLTARSASGKSELSYLVQTDSGQIERMVMSDLQSGHKVREIYNLCHHEYGGGQWLPRVAVRVDYDGGVLKRAHLRRILQATFNTNQVVGPLSIPAAQGDTIVDLRGATRRVFKAAEAVEDVKTARPY
jgi:hypothetical protein